MKLLHWSCMKRHQVKALFDAFPNSPVILRKIKTIILFTMYNGPSPIHQWTLTISKQWSCFSIKNLLTKIIIKAEKKRELIIL